MIAKQKYKAKNTLPPSEIGAYRDDAQFYLDWAEYIYSKYCGNSCFIPCDKVGVDMNKLELYAKGNQDIESYRRKLDPKINGERLWSINWGIEPLFPQAIRQIKGIFEPIKSNFIVNSSDGFSTELKKKIIAESKLISNPQFKDLVKKTGIKPSQQKGVEFESPSHVDLAVDLEEIKLDYEVMMETLLDATLDENDFDNTIKPQLLGDLINSNIAVVKSTPDASGRVNIRRVDPKFFISDSTPHPDFRGATFQAEIRNMKIHELRQMGVDEVSLAKIAKKMGGINKKYSKRIDWKGLYGRSDTIHEISDFDIPVLEYYFISDRTEIYLSGIDRVGAKVCERVTSKEEVDGYELLESKLEEHTIQSQYHAFWVIDTKFCFNFGEKDVVRTGEVGHKKVRSPFVAVRGDEVSLVEGAISAVDDFHIALFKLKNAILNTAPDSIGMDLSLLEPTVTMSNQKYNILSLVKMWIRTGRFVYRSKNEHGNLFGGSNRPPIHPIADTGGAAVERFATAMVMAYERFEKAMGISAIDKMEDPNERAGVFNNSSGVVSNNSLKDILTKYKVLLNLLKNSIADNILHLSRKGLLDYNHPDLEYATCDNIGLNVEVIDTKSITQELMMMIEKRYSEGVIAEDVKFKVLNLVRDGRFRKAQLILSIEVKKAQELKRMYELQNIKLQGQVNKENAVTAGQVKSQTEQIKGQLDLQKLQTKLSGDMELAKLKHKQRMEELEFIKSNNMKDSSFVGV